MKTLNERGADAIMALVCANFYETVVKILASYGAKKFCEVPNWDLATAVFDLECKVAELIDQEKPMTLLDDMILTRFGRRQMKSARDKAFREATDRLRAHAEDLMLQVEATTPPHHLVDVQTYDDVFSHNRDKLWVQRTYSDGSARKCLTPRTIAADICEAFEAGKKVLDRR